MTHKIYGEHTQQPTQKLNFPWGQILPVTLSLILFLGSVTMSYATYRERVLTMADKMEATNKAVVALQEELINVRIAIAKLEVAITKNTNRSNQ